MLLARAGHHGGQFYVSKGGEGRAGLKGAKSYRGFDPQLRQEDLEEQNARAIAAALYIKRSKSLTGTKKCNQSLSHGKFCFPFDALLHLAKSNGLLYLRPLYCWISDVWMSWSCLVALRRFVARHQWKDHLPNTCEKSLQRWVQTVWRNLRLHACLAWRRDARTCPTPEPELSCFPAQKCQLLRKLEGGCGGEMWGALPGLRGQCSSGKWPCETGMESGALVSRRIAVLLPPVRKLGQNSCIISGSQHWFKPGLVHRQPP